MTLRTVVVDDEPLARRRLRRLLEAHRDVEIVGEAADGASALSLLYALAPDLVFLDVRMPGGSGFDVLAGLRERPHIVFVTAYDEFAVRAFEEQALDYLLKPVEPARLDRALARARDAAPASDDTRERIERLLQALAPGRFSQRLPARRGAKVTLIAPSTIAFCRAEDKYTVVYTADGEHVVDRTIEELARTLDPSSFLRIHRSALVNLAYVKDLTSVDGGRFLVTLTDAQGTRLYASRAGAKALREKFGF